jgi:hypothetical protein
MATQPRTMKAHCNPCVGRRDHEVLKRVQTSWHEDLDDGHEISGTKTYYLIKCRGCGTIHLQHDSTMSEDTEPDGRPVVTTVYYPPAISRREPEWLNSVNSPFWWGAHG